MILRVSSAGSRVALLPRIGFHAPKNSFECTPSTLVFSACLFHIMEHYYIQIKARGLHY